MYTIVLIAALFGSNAEIPTQYTSITKEACTLVATKLQAASGLQHKCIPAPVPAPAFKQ